MRIGIITSKATSLQNVAKDIAYVLMKRKHTPRIITYLSSPYSLAPLCDALIMIYPASPLFCSPQFLFYRDWKTYIEKPIIFYTTIEGRPSRKSLQEWMIRDVEFIANSQYTYEKLTEVGFTVIDIIPHALVKSQIESARELVPIARKNLQQLHGDKVIFGAIAFYHARKGLDYLASACVQLAQKRDDFVVHLVTNLETKRVLGDVPHLYIDTVFGTRAREEILAFMGACDFVIVPSLAEGFGLPLLEANAMGTPVIHCAYKPLTEISDLQNNITFEYRDIKYVDLQEGIDYEFHIYETKKLVEAMDYAIDMIKNDPQEYEKRCEKLKNVIKKYDAEKIYSRFIDYLKGE